MALDFKKPGGKEFLIIGGSVAGLALLYFWWRNRQAANAAAAANQQQASTSATSPTGLLFSWIRDHQSSSSSSATVKVPYVVGLTDSAGDAAIAAAGLHVDDTNEKPGGSGGNTKIASTSPPGGTMVAPGSTVQVTLVSSTPKKPVKSGSGDKGGDG